jgi:hypothetical protein
MPSCAGELREIVTRAAEQLASVGQTEAGRRPAPEKWSAKEIIGHLVDSAANNHQRFVRAAAGNDLVFDGYDQDEWVRVQRYQDAPWAEVLSLWRAYNLHIARVIEATPEEARLRPRLRHNLHEIAFRTIPQDKPATLDAFMRDYVDHLRHHLRQVAALVDAPRSGIDFPR